MNACSIDLHVSHHHLDDSLDAPKVNVGESPMSIVGQSCEETTERDDDVHDSKQIVHSQICHSELCVYVDAPAQAAIVRSVQFSHAEGLCPAQRHKTNLR